MISRRARKEFEPVLWLISHRFNIWSLLHNHTRCVHEVIPFIVMRLNVPLKNRKTDQLIRTRNLLAKIIHNVVTVKYFNSAANSTSTMVSIMRKHAIGYGQDEIFESIIINSLINIQLFQPCNLKQTELSSKVYTLICLNIVNNISEIQLFFNWTKARNYFNTKQWNTEVVVENFESIEIQTSRVFISLFGHWLHYEFQ